MNSTGPRVPAVALIDGEHYPPVTLDALKYLEEERSYRIVAIVFLGGTEKLANLESFSYRGVPVYGGRGQVEDLARALEEHAAEMVLDLSDEPVVGYRERFKLISIALAHGVSYRGADFLFEAPERPYACQKAAIGVWGSGKRVGKTAISGYVARRLLERGTRPCVLTMGRGGPREPELLSRPVEVDDEYLRDRAARGCHAASDHFEDAMMSRVVTVGCRRCGGGMAGEPFYSNVPEGAIVACAQDCDIIISEGSGAAIPPIGVDASLLAVSAVQPNEYVLGYLGTYRLLISDVIVVTMCEDSLVSIVKLRELVDGILSINPEVTVVRTVFRPSPIGEINGRKIFLTSTAPPDAVSIQAGYLREHYGAEVVGQSPNLANRAKLERDLAGAEEAEVFVTELKAAGVDTVSMFAKRAGKELVYVENRPVAVDGNLDEAIDYLEVLARERFQGR